MKIIDFVNADKTLPADYVWNTLRPHLDLTAAWLTDQYPDLTDDFTVEITDYNTAAIYYNRSPAEVFIVHVKPYFSYASAEAWNLTSRWIPPLSPQEENYAGTLANFAGVWLGRRSPTTGEDGDTVLRAWLIEHHAWAWEEMQKPPPPQSAAKDHPSELPRLCPGVCGCGRYRRPLPHRVQRVKGPTPPADACENRF